MKVIALAKSLSLKRPNHKDALLIQFQAALHT